MSAFWCEATKLRAVIGWRSHLRNCGDLVEELKRYVLTLSSCLLVSKLEEVL